MLGFLGSVAFPLLRTKLGTSFTALIGCTTKDILYQTPLLANLNLHIQSHLPGVSILVLCDAICAISIFLPTSKLITKTNTTTSQLMAKTNTTSPLISEAEDKTAKMGPVRRKNNSQLLCKF